MGNKPTSTTNTALKHLEHELRDRETEIALLSETVNVVNSELDIETVFQLVTQRAQTLINAESVLIPLLDADCLQYTYRAGYGKNTEEIIARVCRWTSGCAVGFGDISAHGGEVFSTNLRRKKETNGKRRPALSSSCRYSENVIFWAGLSDQ